MNLNLLSIKRRMIPKYPILILLISLISIVLLSQLNITNDLNNEINDSKYTFENESIFYENIQSSASDVPIDINDNGDLAFYADYGLGTYEEPYVFENKTWYGYAYGIDIDSTDKPTVIRNCTVYNMGGGLNNAGFVIRGGAANITITNCTIYGGTGHGIRSLGYAENCTISNCTIYDHVYNGIYLAWSWDFTIKDCIIYDHNESGQSGIYIQDCDRTLIENCVLDHNYYGVFSYSGQHVTYMNNHVTNNTNDGIYIRQSGSAVLVNNTVANNTAEEGVYFYQSNNAELYDNTIINNSEGVEFQSSNDALMKQNNISLNAGDQIYSGGSSGGIFWLNVIGSGSTTSSSLVTGFGNDWYNEGFGNYWGNYDIRYPSANKDGNFWDTPYVCFSSDLDIYPLITDNFTLLKPVVSNPEDISYKMGNEGNNISWILYDPTVNNPTYSVYNNSMEFISNQNWNSGSEINVSVDGLSVGNYNFTIIVNDGLGNQTIDQLNVTVYDDTIPVAISSGDKFVAKDSSYDIKWNVTDIDDTSGTYFILLDDVGVFSGSWDNNTIFTYPVNTAISGSFNYTLRYSDGLKNGTETTVIINVNNVPTISSPNNQHVSLGSSPTIEWVVSDSDNSTGTYWVLKDGVGQSGGIWASGVSISYADIDTDVSGSYTYTIQYWDNFNNGTIDEVTIDVNYIPTINSPNDQITPLGSSPTIGWIISDIDNSTGTYWVLKDGVGQSGGIWTSGVSINYADIDTDVSGSYSYTIQYWDGKNNGTIDEVIIYINYVPSINTPNDQHVAIGSSPIIEWIIDDVDDTIGTYWVLKDGVGQSGGTWWDGSSISFNDIDTDVSGSFTYSIQYWDGNNNGTIDEIVINVNYIPSKSTPMDQQIALGSKPTIGWVISDTDDSTGTYWVLKDGVGQSGGVWTSGISINYADIDTEISGLYTYTIQYSDGLNNGTIDEVVINVNYLPTSNSPDDQQIALGSTPTIGWVISDTDDSTGTYWVFKDGVGQSGGVWTSGGLISFNDVETDVSGSYSYTIQYSDGLNNGTIDEVVINVNHLPMISNPVDINIPIGENLVINWTVYDIDNVNGEYFILLNGVGIMTGTWDNASYFTLSDIDTSSSGTIELTIQYSDGLNNGTNDLIIIYIYSEYSIIYNQIKQIESGISQLKVTDLDLLSMIINLNLSTNANISISKFENNAPIQNIEKESLKKALFYYNISLTPSDSLSNATMRFYINSSELTNEELQNLKIYYLNEKSGNWIELNGIINSDSMGTYLLFETEHLSIFAVAIDIPSNPVIPQMNIIIISIISLVIGMGIAVVIIKIIKQ